MASGGELPDDFFYDLKSFERETPTSELPSSFAAPYHSFAFESAKRSNLHYLDDGATLLYAAGNYLHFIDLATMKQSYLPSVGGRGIGAIAVHPSKQYICVAEVGAEGAPPAAYLYEYPSLRLYRVLRHGTERAYTAVCFNVLGDKVASVGAFPDFMLTVWNWKQELITLRSKAFAQEVFNVSFSPRTDGQLVTSGMVHIRFWKMAHTFTGLKLQGEMGKFGTVDLSDISGYVELPDGKVVSTTETGRLLVWEGGLIKTEVQRPGGVPIHAGTIDSIVIDEEAQQVLTGGDDGFVRTWDLATLLAADRTDESPVFEIEPLSEVSLAGVEPGRDQARVQAMVKGAGHWLVQDAQGSLHRLAAETNEARPLLGFHAGAVHGVDTCPTSHSAVTCGQDGSVRLWDYVGKALLYARRFGAAATCVTWASQAVDTQARTLAAGFADGVLRVFTRAKDDLVLQVAIKPHASRITCLSYAPDASAVATAGEDGCVFFVALDAAGNSYEPIGFMAHPAASPVTCMCWSCDSSVLYVGYRSGDLYELKPPSLAKVDTSVTFELPFEGELLDTSACRPPKPKVEPPPEPTEQEAEEAALAALADPAAAAEAAAAAAEAEAAAAAAEAAELPPAVLSVDCLEGGSLLLALDGQPGLLWEREGALPPVQHCRGEAPLCFVATSRSGRYALTASVDGSVATSEASKLGSVWRGYLHGAAPSVVARLSFDDAFLLTAGADGLYCSKIAPNQPRDAVLSEAALPLAAEQGAPATDISSSSAYSMEEEKQKAESDAREAAAAEKRLGVGGQIDRLRAEFTALLGKHAALGAADQIAREELAIDPGLKEAIVLETEARLIETKAELAWASEKAELALTKLKQTFLEQVVVHHLELHGFETGTSVCTFRSTRLAGWQQAAIEEVHALISTEGEQRARLPGGGPGAHNGDAAGDEEGAPAEAAEAGGAGGEVAPGGEVARMDSLKDERLRRAEAKAAARAARAKEWSAFEARRPDDKYEAPEDAAAIEDAETRMGNFALKTEGDYVVPEAQRVNAQKKRRQLVLLDESIHAIKLGFNERVLALRDLKKRMLAHMGEEQARLLELHAELQLPPPVPPPTELLTEEEPERRRHFTEEELAAYAEQKAVAAAKAAGGGGMGAMGGAAGAPASPAKAAARLGLGAPAGGAPRAGGGGGATSARTSALARGEEALRAAKLEYERSRLEERRRRAITSFDGALEELRCERLKLEADLKTTDLRKLVLLQELRLLKEFEKNDLSLASRLEKKHAEKSEIVAKVAECQERLALKKVEIEKLLEKDKLIMTEMSQALGEGNKYSEVLLTIFKKKVKRSKRGGDDGDDDDEDDEEEDESDEEFDSDEEEEEEEEVCPPGCDPALYEKVCELRERRLEQEELYADFQKGVDGLKKENDALIRKEKVIDKALKDTEVDIQAFQTEKQGKLNQLLVVMTLHVRQVQHLELAAGESQRTEGGESQRTEGPPSPGAPEAEGESGGGEGEATSGPSAVLPADTSESLVFASSELARLRRRLSELAREKSEARQVLKGLRAENGVLARQQGGKAEKLRELEARAYDVQMLKFGQVINLEAIESVSVNKGAEELKERVRQLEAQQQRQLKGLHAKLRGAKLELKAATEASTSSLNSVASLFERQQKLEGDLNSKAAASGREEASERRERQHLVQLVKIQAKEVEALKLEIKMLRRKGGHVYSAPVPA